MLGVLCKKIKYEKKLFNYLRNFTTIDHCAVMFCLQNIYIGKNYYRENETSYNWYYWC